MKHNHCFRLLGRICALLIVVALSGCGRERAQMLRLSHITSPGSAWDKGAVRFAELVQERSQGRVQVQVFPGAQLAQHNQKAELQQLCDGTIDMTLHSSIILALILDRRFDAFSLPWLFPDHQTANRVCDGAFGRQALSWLNEHGVHGIAYGVNGFRQLTNSVRAVRKPDDLRGMKVRVAGTDLFRAVFTAFGANPLTMNFGEVFTALQQGTISAQENPLSIIASSKFYEVQQHLTLWNYAYDPLILTINQRRWNAMSEQDRALITECGLEAMAYQRSVVAEEDRRLVAELEQKGMTVCALSAEELDVFRAGVAAVYEEFTPRIGSEIVELLQSEVRSAGKPEAETEPAAE